MKRAKFFAGAIALTLAMGLALASCSNDDDNSTEVSEADIELGNSAFTVLRSLTDLVQYDPNKQTDEDGVVTGIETLPSNWKNLTFTCNQGVVLDDSNSTVRSVAVLDEEDAKDFFSDIIGEEMESESCSWSVAGIGSLSFQTVSDDDDIFAKIFVNIAVLPDVTEIDLVPYDVVTGTNAENSYSGKAYYAAGDIIRNIKDNTLWMCVRPAGGPAKKDKSYWMCLNPAGKNIIKSETKRVSVTNSETGKKETQTWTYAKNLMSLKTAKAAMFTLNCLANPNTYELFDNCKNIYDALYERNVDLQKISAAYIDGALLQEQMKGSTAFAFAYGSPKNDSKRPNASEVKYVQPYALSGATISKDAGYTLLLSIRTEYEPGFYPRLISFTDAYDIGYANSADTVRDDDLVDDPYNFENFLHTYSEETDVGLHFVKDENSVWLGIDGLTYRAVVSPELCLKDNKGNKDEAKKPSKSYEDVFRSCEDQDYAFGEVAVFDYWDAVEKTHFYVNKVEVNGIDN